MTYVVDGKQIILVPAGAPGVAGEFIALRLEEPVSGTAAAPATRR
jgi:hypothetical protein